MDQTTRKTTATTRIASIDIDGILGLPEEEQFGEWDGRVATYERFESALEEIRASGEIDRLVLNIRSTGGCVADALLIYDAARELGVEVVTRCYGYVASAATIIAQAASKGRREISANSLYLIHCCESSVEGNTYSLGATKEMLDKSDERLSEIYALASGRSAKEYRELMNRNSGKGVWLSPEECIEAGLADRIIASSPITDSLKERITCLGLTPLPPKSLTERLKEVWDKVLRQLGTKESPSVAEEPGSVERIVVPSAAEESSKTTPPVPPSRLHTAQPTRVKECEDPAPNGVSTLSPNESAYANDAMSLREAFSRGMK